MIKTGRRTIIVTYKCGHTNETEVLDFKACEGLYLEALKETDCPACQFANKHPKLGKSIIF